jgi:hypothetical protein
MSGANSQMRGRQMKRTVKRGLCREAAALITVMAVSLSGTVHAEVIKKGFKGSCDDLKDFIKRAGVTDAGKQNHPQAAAWSTFDITSTPYQLKYTSENKGREVCLGATLKDNVVFSVTQQVTRLDWQPLGVVSNDCLAERDRWQKALEQGEEQRAAEDNAIIAEANKAWSAAPHSYRACAGNESLAQSALRQQVEKDVTLQMEKIKAKRQRAVETASGNTGALQLDCSKCGGK